MSAFDGFECEAFEEFVKLWVFFVPRPPSFFEVVIQRVLQTLTISLPGVPPILRETEEPCP